MNERKPVGQENAMEAAATSKKTTNKPAKLGRDVQARLGQQLRSMYDEVVNQGVLDRFTDLLNRLDNNGSNDAQLWQWTNQSAKPSFARSRAFVPLRFL